MLDRAYMADRNRPYPIINYAVNPSFEDGDPPSVSAPLTFSPFTRGWGIQKGAAGDTVIVARDTLVVDTLYGGAQSAQVNKTGTAGSFWLIQAVPERINRRFFNRQYTVGVRVSCNAVGIARLANYNGPAAGYTYGPSNIRSDGVWETLYATVQPSQHSGNSIAFGINIPAGIAGSCNVDSAFLVDGPLPPHPRQYSCTPPTSGIYIPDGLGPNADPKCVKSMDTITIALGVTTLLPFNTASYDTDQMGLTNGRITIRTDGRYHVGWGVLNTSANAGTLYYTYVTRNTTVPFRGGSTTQPLVAGYTNGAAYTAFIGSFVEDFVSGDYLEVYCYVSAGGNLALNVGDTFFEVARLGD